MITLALLAVVMPTAGTRAAPYLSPLLAACDEFDVTTPRRIACFLAQVAEETEELRYVRELADGKAYDPPALVAAELGNTQAGDGPRYKGRGLLQATGRRMYQRLQDELNVPLIASPELLEQPGPACRSAGYIWAVVKELNACADTDQFGACTHKINGGYLGLDRRIAYWLRARKALGL